MQPRINPEYPCAAHAVQKSSLRAKFEAWLNRQWYGKQRPMFALRALVPVYQCLRYLDAHFGRKIAADATCEQMPPIIVVGNLTVGGSGKTPLVIWLVHQALAAGLKPGVISRGYGGTYRSRTAALIVGRSAAAGWRECGDEPQLIANRSGVPVAVCADRMVAAQALAHECDVLFCDDGLQNRRLLRSAEILVIDGERRFGNGYLLPAGPLRTELPQDLAVRYPLRVCTVADQATQLQPDNAGAIPGVIPGVIPGANAGEYAMRLVGGTAVNTKTQEQRPLSAFSGLSVCALAGIGNPERFYQSLRQHNILVEPIPVGDHGVVANAHWQALTEKNTATRPLLLTEKDAIKYPASENAWAVPVTAELPDKLWQHCRLIIKNARLTVKNTAEGGQS